MTKYTEREEHVAKYTEVVKQVSNQEEGDVTKYNMGERHKTKYTVREGCMIKSSVGARDMMEYTVREDAKAKYTGVRERIQRWQERIEGGRDMEKHCVKTFGLTRPVIELEKEENKCKVEQELQQVIVEEKKADICDYKDYISILKEKTNLVSDFRKMPRVQSISELKMKSKRMKRLQDGPKESSRKLQLDQKTGIALRRIINQIIEANPKITLGEEGRKFAKRMETKGME